MKNWIILILIVVMGLGIFADVGKDRAYASLRDDFKTKAKALAMQETYTIELKAKKNQYWEEAAAAEAKLADAEEDLEVLGMYYDVATRQVFDSEWGMQWLQEEATKAQVKRWLAGDWTEFDDAILRARALVDASLESH